MKIELKDQIMRNKYMTIIFSCGGLNSSSLNAATFLILHRVKEAGFGHQ